MNNTSQFTHRQFGLDRNVWLVLITTVVLSLGLLGYKRGFEKKCTKFNIGIKNVTSGNLKAIYAGEILSLSTSSDRGSNINWDFGDKTGTKEGEVVLHSYNKEGEYSVIARVDGRCEQIAVILVRKFVPTSISNDANISTPVSILGKEDPVVGEAVTFTSSMQASNYEWIVLDRRDYETKKGETATYTFRTPGRYVLKLKLDNNPAKTSTKYVMVVPPSSTTPLPTKRLIPPPIPRYIPQSETKPVVTAPEKVAEKPVEKPKDEKVAEPAKPKKVFYIPNARFMDFLQEVVEGSKDLSFFNQYLNNGGETLVKVKGEDKMIRFSELYQQIHDNKKIVLKEVTIDRDANNDVLKININFKKKSLLGL